MNVLYIGSVGLLLGFGVGLELIESFAEQACTRDTMFSLQIDDHFDDFILNASVVEPKFLGISNRTVDIKFLNSLNPSFNMNYSSISFFQDKVLVLESSGIVIYKGINAYKYFVIVEPELVQYYQDHGLGTYTEIRGGLTFVVFNSTSVLFFTLKDQKFPQQIAELHNFNNIIEVVVNDDRIIVVESTVLKSITVVDYEIGWALNLEEVKFSNLNIGQISVSDCYIKESSLFLLDEQKGVLEFNNYVQFKRLLNITGSKIAGHGDYLLVDNTEFNLNTFSVKEYKFSMPCVYLSMNSLFVFCTSAKTMQIYSRKLDLTQNKFLGVVRDVKVFKELLFVGLFNRVEIYQAVFGPLYVEGRVPDVVAEYKVNFVVTDGKNTLSEWFVLNVQYSLTNVIIFILLSFVTVFGSVFVCSFICKCINKDEEEKKNEEVQSTEGQGMPSTDRNLASDRELIPRHR